MIEIAIDGDTLCYKASFATQYKTYIWEEQSWRYKRDLQEYLRLWYDEDERPSFDLDIKIEETIEPVSHTLYILDNMMESIKTDTKADKVVVYISGEGNYRKNIPYPVQYKGNRPSKPVRLEDCRQHLINRFQAIIVNGAEADDAVGMSASHAIMVHVDKDINQVPGKHYHIDTRQIYDVTELEGFRSFYRQMLMGDRVDSVIGCEGIGPKTAEKLINSLNSQIEMEKVVRQKYKEHFGPTWQDMYRHNYDLLWVHRNKEELEEVIKYYDTSKREAEGKGTSEVGEGSDNSSVQSPS